MNDPIRVAVTGAAGNIGYSLLWRVASGDCFGPDQPVILQLLEIPPGMERLQGVMMELNDSAFPLVHSVMGTADANEAFADTDAVFLVGSRPRSKDMDRSDLVAANGPIFVGQGKALNDSAKRSVKVITVGNPCNTNCLIANANAPDLADSWFLGHDPSRPEPRGRPARHQGGCCGCRHRRCVHLGKPRRHDVARHQSCHGGRPSGLRGVRRRVAARRLQDHRGHPRQGRHQGSWCVLCSVCSVRSRRSHARLVARDVWPDRVHGHPERGLVRRAPKA